MYKNKSIKIEISAKERQKKQKRIATPFNHTGVGKPKQTQIVWHKTNKCTKKKKQNRIKPTVTGEFELA